MIDQIHAVYTVTWLPICVMCAIAGYFFGDRGMIRSAAVVAISQLSLDLWFSYGPGFIHDQQPWQAYLLIYGIACTVVTIRPTTRLCSLVGGINLGGVAFAVIHAMTNGDDELFWFNNLMIGVCLLLVLLGGVFYDLGKTLLARLRSRFDRVARIPRQGGMG